MIKEIQKLQQISNSIGKQKNANAIYRMLFDSAFDTLNNLKRWNGLNIIKDETVSQHSYIVTILSRILGEKLFISNRRSEYILEVVTAAMFHDFDEIFTGDITHNVKYNPVNGKEFRDVLNVFVDEKIQENFNNSEFYFIKNSLEKEPWNELIHKIVKIADWMSMFFFLKKEMYLGNLSLLEQYHYCVDNIIEKSYELKNLVELNDDFNQNHPFDLRDELDLTILDDIVKIFKELK